MNEIKYQFVYDKDKNIISVDDAVKGVKYYCIGCGKEMIFCYGSKVQSYFRHKNLVDQNSLKNCNESYLHYIAKMKYVEKINNGCLMVKYNDKTTNIMDKCYYVGVEKKVIVNGRSYTADILLKDINTDKPILLEIKVSHACEPQKIKDCIIFEVEIKKESDIDNNIPVLLTKDSVIEPKISVIKPQITKKRNNKVIFEDIVEIREDKLNYYLNKSDFNKSHWIGDVSWVKDKKCPIGDICDKCRKDNVIVVDQKWVLTLYGEELIDVTIPCECKEWNCPFYRIRNYEDYPTLNKDYKIIL